MEMNAQEQAEFQQELQTLYQAYKGDMPWSVFVEQYLAMRPPSKYAEAIRGYAKVVRHADEGAPKGEQPDVQTLEQRVQQLEQLVAALQTEVFTAYQEVLGKKGKGRRTLKGTVDKLCELARVIPAESPWSH